VFDPPTFADVAETLRSMHPDKAPGPSGITGRMFLLGGEAVTKILFHLFREVHRQKRVPAAWKRSNIVMLPKSEAPFNGRLSSMRPIALLEIAQKVFLKIFFSRSALALVNNNVLGDTATSVLPRHQY
jgi:hypothetical protein